MITVPDELAAPLLREGQEARSWVETFPARADHYLRRWQCAPDGKVTNGAVAVIIPVRSPYGAAVIKISHPHPGNVEEHRALRLWQGDGAVQLYDHDPDGFALLLERVEDRHLDVPTDDGITLGGELSARLAVPAPAEVKRLADTTCEWEQQLRDDDHQAGHEPLPERVLDGALETIRDLGRDDTATMLHGDLHCGNILHSERGWVVIDPKGMAGTAAYDAVTMINYRHHDLRGLADPVAEARRRIRMFSAAAGVDPELTDRCVQARAVTGLLWDLSRDGDSRSPNFELRVALAEGLLG